MSTDNVLTTIDKGVGLAQLNRPETRNALSPAMMTDLVEALEAFDADPAVGCLVIAGNDRVFAGGADIKVMAQATAVSQINSLMLPLWRRLTALRKPVIAAVSGYALGGGCELALACDLIVASETATFGQPEVTLGIIPGAGGTQRLTRAVGKAVAMEMVLNNRFLSAAEALRVGLVNRVVPVELYVEEALRLAAEIAARAPLAVRLGKEAVNAAFELPLSGGLAHERRLFYLLFSTEDQKEGMDAFINKRPPVWRGK